MAGCLCGRDRWRGSQCERDRWRGNQLGRDRWLGNHWGRPVAVVGRPVIQLKLAGGEEQVNVTRRVTG